MTRPRAVLVDLDNTLLDFDRAERCALREALRGLGLPYRRGTLELYQRINRVLWARYNRGEIAGHVVAVERFRSLLGAIEAPERWAERLGRSYLARLSQRGDALPGARRAIARLRPHYRLAIVTNGYERVQRSRLRAARLTPLFHAIVTSERTGFAKPDPRIVQAALRQLGVEREQALMVGDDLVTDRGAAEAAGVAFYWLDRGTHRVAKPDRPTRRVPSLLALAAQLLD